MRVIKFVYFDVGGVAIMDFSGTDKWDQLKRELGIVPERKKEFDEFWDKYEREVCLGRDVEGLIPLLEKKFGINLPDDYSLLRDGFVNRFEVNKSTWPVIEEIHGQCKIGLLTNQYTNMLDEILRQRLLPPANWDVVIDSSVDNVVKPDKQIFELGEERAGVKGKQILFVENGAKHVNAAKDFGWLTFLYDPKDSEKSSRELLNYFNEINR